MPRTSDKRERLLVAAKDLIHQRGFKQTTLADIAEASGVPLGNVYYYFKTKDDIAKEVIGERQQDFAAMTRQWLELPGPRERLEALLDMIVEVRDVIAEHGCPVGSLCQELAKEQTALTDAADGMLHWQVAWVKGQFEEMGRENAADLALEFMINLQGISLLANAMRDPKLVEVQVARLRRWLANI